MTIAYFLLMLAFFTKKYKNSNMANPEIINSEYELTAKVFNVTKHGIPLSHDLIVEDFEPVTIVDEAREHDGEMTRNTVGKGFSTELAWVDFYRTAVLNIRHPRTPDITESTETVSGRPHMVGETHLFLENDEDNIVMTPVSEALVNSETSEYAKRWIRGLYNAADYRRPAFYRKLSMIRIIY